MNKKQLLNTYKKIDSFNEKKVDSPVKPPIYRSEYDERLIKDFHYAKFQKNLQNAQKSDTLKALLNKEDWSEEDTNTLLESLR